MDAKNVVAVFVVCLCASISIGASAQAPIPDISSVFAAGKIAGKQYTNDYFGLTLTTTNAEFTKGGFISSQGKRARLIDAEANAKKWEGKYSIAILADALSANPLIRSPEQYLRSVRHQLEKEGLVTVQEESPVTISGLPFMHSIMKSAGQGQPHYQGMYTAFLKGYIVSLQVEAPSLERLQEIVLKMVNFKKPAEIDYSRPVPPCPAPRFIMETSFRPPPSKGIP